MNNTNLTQQIENYLDGNLTTLDRDEFQKLIESDVDIAKDVFLQREIRRVLSDKSKFQFQKKLEYISHKTKRKRQYTNAFVAISTIGAVVLLIFAGIYFFNFSDVSNNEPFLKYYEHYDAGINGKGTLHVSNTLYLNALNKYNENKYIEAIAFFSAISEGSEYYFQKEYFTGLSYMELHLYENAIVHFKKSIQGENNIYSENAEWYLGLCYVKTQKNDEAVKLFEKLLQSKSVYANKAEQVLKEFYNQ